MASRRKSAGDNASPAADAESVADNYGQVEAYEDHREGREIVLRLGDMVLYSHRKMSGNPNVPDSFLLPMMVTAIHDGNTINGLVFSDRSTSVGFEGMKPVFDVSQGEDEGQWQYRP